MKKILVIITTAFVPTGGLTTVMMNYYRQLDKNGLQIDFASTNKAPNSLVDELSGNRGHYYCVGKRIHLLNYFYRLFRLCKNYEIVHVNANSATAAIELLAATIAGVEVRIDHNHNSKSNHPFLHLLMTPLFKFFYTKGVACSADAGNWLFGQGRFTILRNAIDTTKFRFSETMRKQYRRDLGISQKSFVIGHVGKINVQKNHTKLLDVFYEYQKTHDEAVLLCVGYGDLQSQLEVKISDLGLKKKVILTGMRTDVPGFLSAMDMFVFPSRWEGLPLSVVEAQVSGLPCLLSDRISQEVFISSHMKSLSLETASSEWASMIDSLIVEDRETQSTINIQAITKAGYNIMYEAEKLRNLYTGKSLS